MLKAGNLIEGPDGRVYRIVAVNITRNVAKGEAIDLTSADFNARESTPLGVRPEVLGAEFARLRKKRRLTQGLVGAFVGKTVQYLCELEAGKVPNPKLMDLLDICFTYKVKLSDILRDLGV